jgi:hypothetical protein
MNHKFAKTAAAYIAGIVICFGPATVQSIEAGRAEKRECLETDKARAAQGLCGTWVPRAGDGIPKALFWPLWVSYTVAKRAQQEGRTE